MKNEISKINTNRQLKQSNNLCDARYKLTVYEQRMVIAICSQIDDRKGELPIVKVRASDLADFCEFDPSKKYTMVKTTARTLRSRTLEYKMPDGDWYITGWINSAFYNSKDGTITFTFDERLKSELLNLKSAYLLTPAEPLMKFDRNYSVRLYFILKKMLKIRDFEKDLDFFRDRFQLNKGYKLFANLKNKVLDPAIAEINEKSDISVWHEYIKEGRAYTKIHFIVELKTDKKEIAPPDNIEEQVEQPPQLTSSEVVPEPTDHSAGLALLNSVGVNSPSAITEANGEEGKWTEEQQQDYDNLIKIGIWAKKAVQIVDNYDHAQIERNYNGVMKDSKKGTINNIPAVIVAAIKDDTYKGVEEEQVKAREREHERKKAEWEKAQQSKKEKEEQLAKERAEEEALAKIREQHTPEELNAIIEEVKIEYDNNGEQLTKEMETKLKKYGINNRQFQVYRLTEKKFETRTNKIEKIHPESEAIKIDFEVNLKDEKSIENIIKTYYKNGNKCPDKLLKEIEKNGHNWNQFASKFFNKFVEIGKLYDN